MKRILSLLILLLMIMGLIVPFLAIHSITKEETSVVEPISLEDITYKIEVHEIKANPIPSPTPDPYEVASREVEQKMLEIESIEDKKEWFVAYKQIILDYSEWFDPPETIYDYFPEEELELLFRVVQAEIGDEWDFIHKVNVASVILNRLFSEEDNFKYQDTLSRVLVSDEFSTIRNGSYKDVDVSELTILACEYAFMIEDTTDGCMAFRSDDNPPETWGKWKRIFSDGAHYFYK